MTERLLCAVSRLFVGVLLIFAGFAIAQDYRGRIQGAVSDTSKSVIAGAAVTLRNNNTGVAATRSTDGTGRYLFDLVEPGTYSVTVELGGFNRFIQENV
jgi:hypothetical protein